MTAPNRQIPWVGIDGLRAYTAGDLSLVNQVPAPDSTGADQNTSVAFTLMCTVAGRNVDTGGLDVHIRASSTADWRLAIQNGVFKNGFNGTLTTFGTDADVEIFSPWTFDSEAVASVQVECDVDGGGGYAIDETYSFTIEDYQQPSLDTATGWLPTKVRFTFDESMGASALEAANYTIAPYGNDPLAAVTPTVESVELVGSEYEITTNWELTPGAEYLLTASSSVEDAVGNSIDPTGNSVVFTSYDYRDLDRSYDGWQIYEQLAEYDRRRDQSLDLKRFCSVEQNSVDLSLLHIDDLRFLTDPDFCSAEYLDHILYDCGNPLRFVTNEQTKRRIAWRCAELNKKRGTATGIILAVELVTGLICTLVTDRSRRWRLGYREEDVEATANALYVGYEAHRVLTTGGVHGMADTTNVVSPTLYPASGVTETNALLNAIRTAYEAHRIASGVHGWTDTVNVIYRTSATSWTTAANLAGEIVRKFNEHLLVTSPPVHGTADTINEVTQRPGDALDFDTRLGGGDSMPWDFWLQFDQALTTAQRTDIERTAAAMKSAPSHYLGPIEP